MSDLMKFNPAFLDEETLVRTFVVRQKELEAVMEVVRENDGPVNQHLLLIGPRGIGKTTLALRVVAEVRRKSELAQRWYPVVFGEESYLVMNAGEFWLEALLQIAEQTGEERWSQAHETLSREEDPERLELRCLAQLMDFADEQGRRLLLIVENINMMLDDQVSEDEAWHLRHTLLNEPRLMLLGTATRRFEGIEHEGKALYDLFRVVDLHPLDSLNEIGALWALATEQEPRKALLRPIEILTGGNPRLIRILSEFAARTSFRELMDNLIRLIDDHTEYFKHHLDSLPAQERKVFVALADRWDPATAREIAEATRLDVSKVSALLARLEKRGAVSVPKQHGRTKVYQIAERLYNIYHLMRRRGQASARVRAVVRFMIAIYEGEKVIPIMRRLLDEAAGLSPAQRQEHYLAYTEVLDLSNPEVRARIITETRDHFEKLVDVPSDLQERLAGADRDPFSGVPIDDLLRVDVNEISSPARLRQLAVALMSEPPATSTTPVLEAMLRVSRRLTDLDPGDAAAWHNLGVALNNLGQFDEALGAFEGALTIKSESAMTWFSHGLALGMLSRHGDAIESFDRALAIEPEIAAAWHNRGVALDHVGRHQEALESFDRALAIDREEVLTWRARGDALGGLRRFEEALESYQHGLAIDSGDALTWRARGFALNTLGRSEEALESFDHALLLEPDEVSTLRARGSVLGQLGRFEEALESYDRALAIEPDHAATWRIRGYALQDLGQREQALESFDRALALGPEVAAIWNARGYLLDELGRYEEALLSLDQSLAIDPTNAAAWNDRGVVLENLSRSEEALESFDRALEIRSDDALAWRNRSIVHFNKGQYKEALEAIDHAIALDINNEQLGLNRSEILSELQRYQQALSSLESILQAPIKPGALSDLIDVVISLAAHSHTRAILKLLIESPVAEAVEPLIVALRLDLGEEVTVAQEIEEIAKDILARIHSKRESLRSEA